VAESGVHQASFEYFSALQNPLSSYVAVSFLSKTPPDFQISHPQLLMHVN
jgi:hypothetical protein